MDLVKYAEILVKNLVVDSDMIKVELFSGDEPTLEIMVPDSQMKFVIGRGGKNIHALRTLIHAYTYLNKLPRVKINVEAF